MYLSFFDLFLLVLVCTSVWLVINTSVFRNNFLSFLLCLLTATVWGFYASFDVFVFFLVMSEFLIVMLLLIAFLSHNFVSLNNSIPNILFFLFLAIASGFQVFISGVRSTHFLQEYHVVYNYFLEIVSSDLFHFFHFFFLEYFVSIFYITFILSFFSIFFIWCNFTMRFLTQNHNITSNTYELYSNQQLHNQNNFNAQVRIFNN